MRTKLLPLLSLGLILTIGTRLVSVGHAQTPVIPNDPMFSDQWNLQSISAPLGWETATSTPVVVAVVDSGVDFTHEDLAANAWVNPHPTFGCDINGYNFAANNCDISPLTEHGTRLAGIIGAVGNNGKGIAGVAWNIRIMALKVEPTAGTIDPDAAALAMRYAVDNGAKIVNLSWQSDSTNLGLAIAYAQSKGVIVTTSAGNSGANNDMTAHFPSNYDLTYDNVVALANIDSSDSLNPTSNYGPTSVQMAAPGTDILSTCPVSFCSGGYDIASGTSDSPPHFAAVAALVWGHFPTLTYKEVISRILGSGDPLPSLSGLISCGCKLDYAKAIAAPAVSNPACVGVDFNGDGKVEIQDLAIFALHYGTVLGQPLYGTRYDLNSDGKVDILDLSIFALQYGKTC